MAVQQPIEEPAELDQLQELLNAGDIEQARTLLAELRVKYPEHPRIAYLARVLERPRAVAVDAPLLPPRDQELAWLKAHAREHRGCWLALSGDSLIAADPDYGVVVDRARDSVGLENVVLYFPP